MAVVVADVIAVAPEFADVDSEVVELMLAQAERRVSRSAWGSMADDGVTYLAAHLLKLRAIAAAQVSSGTADRGPLISETVGPVSRSYAAPSTSSSGDGWLAQTAYGQAYLDLRALILSPRML